MEQRIEELRQMSRAQLIQRIIDLEDAQWVVPAVEIASEPAADAEVPAEASEPQSKRRGK